VTAEGKMVPNLCVQRTRVKQGRALPASRPRAADAGRSASRLVRLGAGKREVAMAQHDA
jgi:hypothetical protein